MYINLGIKAIIKTRVNIMASQHRHFVIKLANCLVKEYKVR